MFAKTKLMSLIVHKIVPLVTIFSLLTADSFAAYFYLKDNPNIIKGCPTTIEIGLNTEGARILAADAVAYFDVAQATVQSLGLGSILPMPTFNSIVGQKLSISGARFPQSGEFTGDGVFGSINLTPLNSASKLNINFSNDLNTDIVIAELLPNSEIANAATKVESKEFAVKDRYNSNINGGFCDPDTTPPGVTFVLPPNGANGVAVDTNIVFSISDDRAGVDINTLRYSIKGVNYSNTTPQTTVTESNGIFRVETDPAASFNQGESVTTSVYICDLNVPANCGTRQGTFTTYTPPPPDPVCGDGIVTYQVGEQCDDGNTNDGDGCSSLCLWERPPEEITPPAECPAPTVCPTCETCPAATTPPAEVTQPTTPVTQPEEQPTQVKPAAPEEIAPEVYMEPIAGCTREEVTKEIMDKFDIISRYSARDAACQKDIEHCMLPFLIHTSYKDVNLETGNYYPDVFLTKDQGDRPLLQGEGPVTQESKNAINFGTRMGMVQGFYEDVINLSPFRPKYNMTRAQIVKLLNWAAFGQEWQYEDEYYAQIGGQENLSKVKKSFSDLLEWWYPRYLNTACDKGIINCDPEVPFSPDEICSPTWKRDIEAKYQVFYKQQNQTGFEDTDKDTITDRDEENVFYTDYTKPDTDGDTLNDGQEVTIYKSNPNLADTDGDGLKDGDEVNKYKTDPTNQDTDGDGFPDGLEVQAGSDPVNANSTPKDANGNGIDDAWEKQYGISPINGTDDTDGDGLSDLMEYRNGTDPTNPDTDGDGLTDSQEVLIYKTNPDVPNTLDDIGVRITNIQDGMILTDLRPFIQGIGREAGMEIEIILRNEFGHEIVLGTTTVDENLAFTFTPTYDLRDGKFYLLAKGLDTKNKTIILSPLVYVTLNSALKVDTPKPERLSSVTLDEKVVLEGVRVEIGSDVSPLLVGRTGFKNKVVATWESVLGTSAIVADLAGGEFRIRAPEDLGYGQHKVTLFAVRDSDQAMSKTVIVNFEIKEPFTQVLHGIAFGEEVIFPNYVWGIIFITGFGLVFYGVKAGKLFRKKKK